MIVWLCDIFPKWRHRSLWPPKDTFLHGNTSFEPLSVKIGPTVRPGREPEKKGQDRRVTNVTKALYFTYLGRSSHLTDLHRNLHSSCRFRHNHVCKVLNWNFHKLRFYRGSNFRFSYWFLHVPYNGELHVKANDGIVILSIRYDAELMGYVLQHWKQWCTKNHSQSRYVLSS